jgi:hypothetical protein
MATRINADGTAETLTPRIGHFALDELQVIVGGYIEAVFLDDDTVMMINEDGKRLGLPVNGRATWVARERGQVPAWDFIVGDVVIGTRREMGGPAHPLDEMDA